MFITWSAVEHTIKTIDAGSTVQRVRVHAIHGVQTVPTDQYDAYAQEPIHYRDTWIKSNQCSDLGLTPGPSARSVCTGRALSVPYGAAFILPWTVQRDNILKMQYDGAIPPGLYAIHTCRFWFIMRWTIRAHAWISLDITCGANMRYIRMFVIELRWVVTIKTIDTVLCVHKLPTVHV
jgi:hypothetical protein